jgi:hypothetical protein
MGLDRTIRPCGKRAASLYSKGDDMNFSIVIAGIIVGWCCVIGAIALLVQQWEQRETERIKPFDSYYQGLQRSLLKELEKELR